MPPDAPPARAAIYARFSPGPDQKIRSIEDQEMMCRELAARRGFEVVAVYADAAISGADETRPQYQGMMAAARSGQFEIVIAEALNRLARDLEETARMKKHLDFAEVRIVTTAEGDIDLMHIGFKGVQNAQFLKDLAVHVRRGQRGRIEKGRAAGGLCYGYRVVKRLGPDGEIERGLREIDPDQAAVVLRIFAEVAGGKSPAQVAKGLNRDGIKPLRGRLWRPSTITGHKARGVGILVNEIYIGKLVYNRVRQVKDPLSGGTVDRVNPKAQWVVRDAPDLRIVPQDLWARVHDAMTRTARQPLHARRRARHMLSGLVYCAGCGAPYILIADNRMGCSTHRDGGPCANGRRISRIELETRTLDGLKDRLLPADMIEVFLDEWSRLEREARAGATQDRAADEKALADISRQIERIVDAIADGTASRTLRDRLADLEKRQQGLADRLSAVAGAGAAIITIPAKAVALYRESVDRLRERLDHAAVRDAAVRDIRCLIERIEIEPAQGRLSRAVLHARAETVFAFASGPYDPAKSGLLMASPDGRRHWPCLPRLVVNI